MSEPVNVVELEHLLHLAEYSVVELEHMNFGDAKDAIDELRVDLQRLIERLTSAEEVPIVIPGYVADRLREEGKL